MVLMCNHIYSPETGVKFYWIFIEIYDFFSYSTTSNKRSTYNSQNCLHGKTILQHVDVLDSLIE